MLADSILGATLQGKYECPACDARSSAATRCATSRCDSEGLAMVDNDGVNFAATLVGAAAAVLQRRRDRPLGCRRRRSRSGRRDDRVAARRAGASVLLVDRARFPRDKACSEYLSPATRNPGAAR